MSDQRLIPAMMVVGTSLDDGEEMVGEVVVCGGVDEGIPVTAVLLEGEGEHSAVNNRCSYVSRVHME